MIPRAMRSMATCGVLLGLCISSGLPAHAQNKAACELVSNADAEAILGVTLLPPKPSAPFRSLLDPDFTNGMPEQGCELTNFRFSYTTPNQPKPFKVVNVRLEVRYSPTPDAHAVDEARKQVDTRTQDHPTDLPGLGDAAFWIGAPNNVTLFVFLGGTPRLMIGPSEIGLEQEKALAAKALASLGKTNFTYGTPTGLNKPVLGKAGPKPGPMDQLKQALTAKADAGDIQAQLALGRLYESASLGQDGKVQHDYAGGAYWYQQASDHGNAQAAYELALLYRGGLGVGADAAKSFQLLQKAAEANYVPAMPMLSNAYADQKTPVSPQRATYWATKAADAGDPVGWLILGFEYASGKLGGNPPYWYQMAMEEFRKAADGGNCVAMMAIAELYSSGKGVPADTAQGQSWSAKAESCQDSNMTVLQQQISGYQARAAAAREPVTLSMLGAIPNIPRLAPRPSRNGQRSGFDWNSDFLGRLVAAGVTLTAINLLLQDKGGASAPDQNSFDQRSLDIDLDYQKFHCIPSGIFQSAGGC
ncbi:MAG: sel1 repeat family protein [Acidobacteriota bacterium]|nr:sel1 repeat family protein [Acidobacteriota bacterium]